MRDFLALFLHILTTLARLLGPGGTRAVIAETLLIKHQLVVLNRSRRRAPVVASIRLMGRRARFAPLGRGLPYGMVSAIASRQRLGGRDA